MTTTLSEFTKSINVRMIEEFLGFGDCEVHMVDGSGYTYSNVIANSIGDSPIDETDIAAYDPNDPDIVLNIPTIQASAAGTVDIISIVRPVSETVVIEFYISSRSVSLLQNVSWDLVQVTPVYTVEAT